MAKKKREGHYCKICGEYKANEKFSGKGHAAHICKLCVPLPIERRNELHRMNQVGQIAMRLRPTKEQWDLLEKYAKNKKYPELQEYATDVLAHHRQMSEARKPQIEDVTYSDLEKEQKEEIEELLYDDLFNFITGKDAIPQKKQLEKITKGICNAYIQYYHLRILPDEAWEEKMKEVLARVVQDLEEDAELSEFEP